MLLLETLILCLLFFVLCVLGTGTDAKNLKNYSSYPDEVQQIIKETEKYRGKFVERGKVAVWLANFALFCVLFFLMGLVIRTRNFDKNFLSLFILGESLNVFDLVVIDLLWWRNTSRIRFSEIPQKSLYQNPKKHVHAFLRAVPLYFLVAIVDGYLLTLF